MSSLRNLAPWQWNQYTVALASFTAFVGFSFSNPFLPLFIHRDLGIADLKEVALWSGWLFAVAPLLSAFSGPLWGTLADRFGYKRMVQRALFTFVLILGAMSFVSNVWQLLILRILMGLLGGFTAMSMALITSLAPRERTGEAVGLLQSSRSISAAIGPLMGGIVADLIGMRPTFVVSAALNGFAFLMMTLIYREDKTAMAQTREARQGASLREAVRAPAFLAVMVMLFLIQLVDNSFGPILPLFVTLLEGSSERAGALTGLIISAAAIATAIASAWLGRFSTRRSPRTLLFVTLLGGALICVPIALSQTTTQLLFWRVLLGLLAGGSMTLAYTLGGMALPAQLRGSGFGILSSAALIGGAVSPILFGALAGFNLRWVFGFDAVIYGLVFVWVLWALRQNPSRELPNHA